MRPWLLLAAISGFVAVALGAYAAHGLQGRLEPRALEWIDTGLRYQMFHAAALIGVAILARDGATLALQLAGWGFALGTLLFCGLLYAMALGAPRWFGAVVPLGGLAFLAGWAALGWYALRAR